MKNAVIELDKGRVKNLARQYFTEICGHQASSRLKPKHVQESLTTIDQVYEGIGLKAIYSKYEGLCLRGDRLVCGEVSFQCRAWPSAAAEGVAGVYAYILTIGNQNIECDRVLYEVYYDIWQTAFVDAGRDLLREHIAASLPSRGLTLSDTFGPGFFGMPATDTIKFFQLLKAEKIGVSVRADGLMLPLKSYAGFFLASARELRLPSRDCRSCVSSGRTCGYCKTGRPHSTGAKPGWIEDDIFKRNHRQASV